MTHSKVVGGLQLGDKKVTVSHLELAVEWCETADPKSDIHIRKKKNCVAVFGEALAAFFPLVNINDPEGAFL